MLELLSAGRAYVIAQTTAYALPPRVVRVHSTVALEISVDGTNYVALSTTTTGVEVGAMFLKCTSATATVAIKYLG